MVACLGREKLNISPFPPESPLASKICLRNMKVSMCLIEQGQ